MENDKKHTPGPWKYHETDEQCIYGPTRTVCYTGDIGGFVNHADGRLAAAAPELLEAAKLTILHFQRMSASDNFLGDDEHECWTALDKAISKAEGRADEQLLFGIDRDKPIDDEKMARLTEEAIKKALSNG